MVNTNTQEVISKGPLDYALFEHIKEYYNPVAIINRFNNNPNGLQSKETPPEDNR
jgi:hypothetical protein